MSAGCGQRATQGSPRLGVHSPPLIYSPRLTTHCAWAGLQSAGTGPDCRVFRSPAGLHGPPGPGPEKTRPGRHASTPPLVVYLDVTLLSVTNDGGGLPAELLPARTASSSSRNSPTRHAGVFSYRLLRAEASSCERVCVSQRVRVRMCAFVSARPYVRVWGCWCLRACVCMLRGGG